MERPQPGAAGRQRAVPVRLGGRRGLALGHAVDPVVHDDIGHVDVAPAGVQEMVAADGKTVAVTAGDQDREIGSRDLETGGERQRAAMHAVKAVAVGVGRNPRRAADTGNHCDIFRRDADFRQGTGDRNQHVIVAATRAPDRLDLRFVVALLVGDRLCVGHHDLHWRTRSAISLGRIGKGPGR